VLAGGTEYAAQYRLVRPDGTICWIEAHGIVARSDSSTHMLGMGIDVTNLKKAQQSGRESEEKCLLLLNSTVEGIYGLDLEGNCIFCNPACLPIKLVRICSARTCTRSCITRGRMGPRTPRMKARSMQQSTKVSPATSPRQCCGVRMERTSRPCIGLLQCTRRGTSSAQWSALCDSARTCSIDSMSFRFNVPLIRVGRSCYD
jgi:hypothetical protein